MWGGDSIKYSLWNINKKNLIYEIEDLVVENDVDICITLESEHLDTDKLVQLLYDDGFKWKEVKVMPKNEDIKVIAKKHVKITVYKEEEDYSIYKVRDKDKMVLLFVVHLVSALYKSREARSVRALELNNLFLRHEKRIYKDEDYKSIVVGDFNLQPFDMGIIGALAFNATMSKERALTIKRTVNREERLFYYNPMWEIMGENEMVQGTYFCNNDQDDLSMYWYTFDEVLLRPALIDKFNWNYFKVVDRIGSDHLMSSAKINTKDYSDHLPLKFEIN